MCSQLFIWYTVYNSVRDFKTDVGRTVDLGNKFPLHRRLCRRKRFSKIRRGIPLRSQVRATAAASISQISGVKILMQLYFILGLSDETVSRGAGDRLKLGVKGNRLFKSSASG